MPSPAEVVVARTAPDADMIWTVRPGPALPVRRGLRTLVRPSPTVPESSAATRLSPEGAAGVVVRMVIAVDGLDRLAMLAGLTWIVAYWWPPSGTGPGSSNVPGPTRWATITPSRSNWTVFRGSVAVTLKVGFATDVVVPVPVRLAGASVGADGAGVGRV